MYINARERINKKDQKVFYLYLCVSRRIDGKVTNTQKYIGKIDEKCLEEKDYSFLESPKIKLSEKDIDIVLRKLEELSQNT